MSLGIISVSTVVIVATAWLAMRPQAEATQTAAMLWFNDPPQPLAAILAVTNPLLRPVPLLMVSVAVVGWALLSTPAWRQRVEMLLSLGVALALSELIAQVMKRLAQQPRPLSVIPGLDPHGYPGSPHGNAYPSAHTAVAVALVTALWPWLRWPQRVVCVVLAVLVPLNRLYIGAHWPLDIVGGVAIGLLAGAVTWLVVARWPLRRTPPAL